MATKRRSLGILLLVLVASAAAGQAPRSAPRSAAGYLSRGNVRWKKGNLAREITEQELLGSATDKDQRTEARAYLGMSLLLSGQREAALTHLRWVREQGAQKSYEYRWAINALRRLEAGLT